MTTRSPQPLAGTSRSARRSQEDDSPPLPTVRAPAGRYDAVMPPRITADRGSSHANPQFEPEPQFSPGTRADTKCSGWAAPVTRGAKVLAVVSLWALLDVISAQICKHSMDSWDRSRAERRYRIASPIYHHDLAKNVNLTATWGSIQYPFATNSLGFRDTRPRAIDPEAATSRVLFIGDSFTEGIGVPYPETYVGRLDQHFAARGVEVLNAAVSSYAPAIYFRKVKYLLEDVGLRFDYVVVAIDLSDIADEALSYRFDKENRVIGANPDSGLAARIKRFLENNSLLFHVADLAGGAIKFARRSEALGAGSARISWTRDRTAYEAYGVDGFRRARANMDSLVELLRRHQIGLAVVVYPWPDQILTRGGDSTSLWITFWSDWAKANSLPFFNLFPPFLADPDSKRTVREDYIPGDVHWNVHGHQVVADALLSDSLIGLLAMPHSKRPSP